MTELEAELLSQMSAAGLPAPITEFQFHPFRKWKADMCYPERKLIIEVMGGTYAHMGHSTGQGIHRDYEKANEAQLLGYTYLQFDRQMIEDGKALNTIKRSLYGKEGC